MPFEQFKNTFVLEQKIGRYAFKFIYAFSDYSNIWRGQAYSLQVQYNNAK